MKQDFTATKDLPDSEKPYEKFLKSGAESLSDAELLAVIIRSGTQGKRSIEVAQDFLAREQRNLLNLYSIPFAEMLKIHGIGQVKAIQLKCIAELSARIAQTKYQEGISLTHPSTIADYYMERMRHEPKEQVMVLFFDAKCRLLEDVKMSIGSATAGFVPSREIFLAALQHKAVQLILLHNHPSGVPTPSVDDDTVTRRVAECGNLLGIPLIDHIIIGDHAYYSYNEHKRII